MSADPDRHLTDDEVAGLPMLPEDDVEVRRAQRHVASCMACAERWESSLTTLCVLDGDSFAMPTDLVERGIRAHGRRLRRRLAAWLGALTTVILLGFWVAWIGIGETLRTQPALKCIGIEVAFGMLTLGATILLARRAARALPPSVGSVSAAVGALCGETYLYLACTDHSAEHLFLAHAGGVVLAAAIGGVLARTLTAYRPSVRALS